MRLWRDKRPWVAAGVVGAAAGASVLANAEPALTPVFVVAVTALTAVGAVIGAVRPPPPPAPPELDPPPVPPALLPVAHGTFRGRAAELDDLRARYDRKQRVLMLHGPPGVGKSALAQEFARRVAADHPDGQLYVDLSWPVHLRSPGEVLKSFLEALAWPSEVPPETQERAKLFRSRTQDQKLLVVLDSVPDRDELEVLLPAGPGCTVIVTSTRDLGRGLPADSRSIAVGPVTGADALAILRARVGLDDCDQAVPAAEVVALCGRLPLALRCAGELAKAGDCDLGRVADLLRPERGRLARLAGAGRDVQGRLAAEFERLTDREQRALMLLGQLDAATFLPLVLVPLLEISLPEAGNLVSQLHAAQLLEVAGPDAPSGTARYAFHPLVRLFVRDRAERSLDPDEADAARDRLTGDYLRAIEYALRVLEPGFRRRAADTGSTRFRMPGFADRIRHDLEDWVRAEYPNLIGGILAAHRRGEWGMAWRVAAHLDEHAVHRAQRERCRQALDRAYDAAGRDGSERGRQAVRLAQAGYAVAQEDYRRLAEVLPDPDPGDRLAYLRARRHLITAYGQMGAYREARAALDALTGELAAPPPPGPPRAELRVEWTLLALSRAEVLGNTSPLHWARDEPYHGIRNDDGSDRLAYRVHLALAEAAGRGRDWAAASAWLRRIPPGDDPVRSAAVAYRAGWLELMRADARDPAASGPDAVGHAAGAVAAYERAGNDSGAIRARCLLAAALLRCGRVADAEQQLEAARRNWRSVRDAAGAVPLAQLNADLLDARLKRVAGELLLRRDPPAATVSLRDAVDTYRRCGDFWSRAEGSRMLAEAHRRTGDRRQAVRLLLGVAQVFTDCGDWSHLRLAVDDLAELSGSF